MPNSGFELESREFLPGQMLFEQGEIGDEAYIVESGLVEITGGDGTAEIVLGVVEPGEMIGEMALIDDVPRMATARAKGHARVIVVPKRAFQRLLREANPVIVSVLRTVIKRLRKETTININRTL